MEGRRTVPTLGARFEKAVALARRLHEGQVRKGTQVPYLTHALAVASLVLEQGADEGETLATLLQDGQEDPGRSRGAAGARAGAPGRREN